MGYDATNCHHSGCSQCTCQWSNRGLMNGWLMWTQGYQGEQHLENTRSIRMGKTGTQQVEHGRSFGCSGNCGARQTIFTKPGTTYRICFEAVMMGTRGVRSGGGNFDATCPATGQLSVRAANDCTCCSTNSPCPLDGSEILKEWFVTTGNSNSNGGVWQSYSYTFTATSTETSIGFYQDLSHFNNCGASRGKSGASYFTFDNIYVNAADPLKHSTYSPFSYCGK